MSPRSRHAPLEAVSHYQNGSRHSVPRHQAASGYSSPSFSSASRDATMSDSHFYLSSAASGSRHRPEPTQWNVMSRSRPQPDDYMSTGYNAMNLTGSINPVSMMAPDAMEVAYDYAAGTPVSRHAPLIEMDEAQAMNQDFMMTDYMSGIDYLPCTTTMASSSMLPAEAWACGFRGPPSPPDEEEVGRQLYLSGHALLPQETVGCEPLGISQIQPYSASRHSVVQPRPIRPHSGRSEPKESSRHSRSPPSSPEDSPEKTNARKDPLYDASPSKDGYFRCPLVKQFGCSHKPTKQRCIYAKYLDSHLRPYKCRFSESTKECFDQRFSSNACLFRHERETHGKHGHGDNPFLCKFANCTRSKPDNGFPRAWNQKDHMKRVHQWVPEEDDEEEPSRGRHAPDSKRRKGVNAPSSVDMKRSDSSYYGRTSTAPYPQGSRHAVTSSRHQAMSYSPMQTGNMTGYGISVDDYQYAQYQAPAYYSGYSQAVY